MANSFKMLVLLFLAWEFYYQWNLNLFIIKIFKGMPKGIVFKENFSVVGC